MALTDDKIALLNQLLYSGDFCKQQNATGLTVREIVRRIDDYIKGGGDTSNWFVTDIDKDIKALLLASQDDDFGNLVVDYVSAATAEHGAIVTFKDNLSSPKTAYVVFQGTANGDEFLEDVYAMLYSDPAGYKEAYQYLNYIEDDYDIIVSGHSKGGNEAQYLAVVSSRVSRCVAFDSPGFSEAFINEYATEIKDNKNKIKCINSAHDWVNQWGIHIADNIEYNEHYSGVDPFFLYNHKLDNIFNDDGILMPEADGPDAVASSLRVVVNNLIKIGAFTALLRNSLDDFNSCMSEIQKAIKEKILNINDDIERFKDNFISFINQYKNGDTILYSKEQFGQHYSDENPLIKLDTDVLQEFSEKLFKISREKIPELNKRIKGLYSKMSGIVSLGLVQAADMKANDKGSIENCAAYLNKVAGDFMKAELNIINFKGDNK